MALPKCLKPGTVIAQLKIGISPRGVRWKNIGNNSMISFLTVPPKMNEGNILATR